jgi:hypothetical protein
LQQRAESSSMGAPTPSTRWERTPPFRLLK